MFPMECYPKTPKEIKPFGYGNLSKQKPLSSVAWRTFFRGTRTSTAAAAEKGRNLRRTYLFSVVPSLLSRAHFPLPTVCLLLTLRRIFYSWEKTCILGWNDMNYCGSVKREREDINCCRARQTLCLFICSLSNFSSLASSTTTSKLLSNLNNVMIICIMSHFISLHSIILLLPFAGALCLSSSREFSLSFTYARCSNVSRCRLRWLY